jgi:hypothetical protein
LEHSDTGVMEAALIPGMRRMPAASVTRALDPAIVASPVALEALATPSTDITALLGALEDETSTPPAILSTERRGAALLAAGQTAALPDPEEDHPLLAPYEIHPTAKASSTAALDSLFAEDSLLGEIQALVLA